MRMRLARNYNFNTHSEASHLRDVVNSPAANFDTKPDGAELLAKVRDRSCDIAAIDHTPSRRLVVTLTQQVPSLRMRNIC